MWTQRPGVPIGCRSPRKRGSYCTPKHTLSSDPERGNWQRIAAYGQLRAFTLTGSEIEGNRRTLSYRAEVGEHLLLLSFALNREGKVSELSLEEEE